MPILHEYLASVANQRLDERVARYKTIDTPEKVRAFQLELRGIARDSLGAATLALCSSDAPPKVLNSRHYNAPGVVIESFLYEVFPNFWASALLYRPEKIRGRNPALVMPVGHWWEGKANAMYQRQMRLLARHGIICASFDGCGQGERVEWFSRPVRDEMQRLRDEHPPGAPLPYALQDAACHGFTLGQNVTTMHSMIGDPGYLCGIHQHGLTALAGKRLIDALRGRRDVDPERIGACGASGGGTDTRFLLALDDRLALAIPASILGSDRSISGGDADQSLFFTINRGISQNDLLICMAPRPLLIVSASADRHNSAGVAEFYRPFWNAFGKGDALAFGTGEGAHGFPLGSRKIIAEFAIKHLLGREETIADDEHSDELPVYSNGAMRASFSGNLVLDGLGKGPRELIAERAAALAKSRPEIQEPAALRAKVLATLCESEATLLAPPPAATVSDGTISWESEGGVPVRIKHEPGANPDILYAHDQGIAGAERSLLLNGVREIKRPLSLIDLRGSGISADPKDTSNIAMIGPLLFNHQSSLGRVALTQGRTMTGLRVVDLLQAAAVLQRQSGSAPDLIAEGALGLTALIATFLKPEAYRRVVLLNTPLSYAELATATDRDYDFSHFLYGVLEHFDTRDLTRALPAQKLTWINPANGSGRVMPLAIAKRAHRGAAVEFKVARVEAELTRVLKGALQV